MIKFNKNCVYRQRKDTILSFDTTTVLTKRIILPFYTHWINKFIRKGLSAYFFCCERRIRTPKRQLAIAQEDWWSTPGSIPALCYVYPVILTPETRGHGCQFHHLTIWWLNKTYFCWCEYNNTLFFMQDL